MRTGLDFKAKLTAKITELKIKLFFRRVVDSEDMKKHHPFQIRFGIHDEYYSGLF